MLFVNSQKTRVLNLLPLPQSLCNESLKPLCKNTRGIDEVHIMSTAPPAYTFTSAKPLHYTMNSDRSKWAYEKTSTQEWVATSKAGTVLRRRVFRLGGQESGRVSSVVEYKPGASFPSHPHPQGEEILVLDGVFSDWRGDHKAGTFLLNPEGFEHAPHSKEGCVLFVRLRQFPGADRPQKALQTPLMKWDGQRRKPLMEPTFGDAQYLQQVGGSGGDVKIGVPNDGVEVFVVKGDATLSFGDGAPEDLKISKHDWIRVPPKDGAMELTLSSVDETVLLVKENTLRVAFAPVQ